MQDYFDDGKLKACPTKWESGFVGCPWRPLFGERAVILNESMLSVAQCTAGIGPRGHNGVDKTRPF